MVSWFDYKLPFYMSASSVLCKYTEHIGYIKTVNVLSLKKLNNAFIADIDNTLFCIFSIYSPGFFI